MSPTKKTYLVGLGVLGFLVLALYLWNLILVWGSRPEKVPYLQFEFGDDVEGIDIDAQGYVWVDKGTEIDVYDKNGQLVKTYDDSNSQPFKDLKKEIDDYGYRRSSPTLTFDRLGRPWLVSNTYLFVLEPDQRLPYPQGCSLSDGHISGMAFDLENRLWIGVNNGNRGVLYVVDGQSCTKYESKTTKLPSNSISDLSIDHLGRIWLSTYGGGVILIDGEQAQSFRSGFSPLLSDYVNVLTVDEQGRAWIGTYEGLNIFDGNDWQSYTPENSGLSHEYIWDIQFDGSGRGWINGDVFDGVQWKYYIPPSLGYFSSKSYYVWEGDSTGRIWLMENSGGLSRNIRKVSKAPENVRLAPRMGVIIHDFFAMGGILLILYLIGLWTALFVKARIALLVSLAITIFSSYPAFSSSFNFLSFDFFYFWNPGILIALCGLVGGILGRWKNEETGSEIGFFALGILPGLLVGGILFIMTFLMMIAD